jgi:hypothetical protein
MYWPEVEGKRMFVEEPEQRTCRPGKEKRCGAKT